MTGKNAQEASSSRRLLLVAGALERNSDGSRTSTVPPLLQYMRKREARTTAGPLRTRSSRSTAHCDTGDLGSVSAVDFDISKHHKRTSSIIWLVKQEVVEPDYGFNCELLAPLLSRGKE